MTRYAIYRHAHALDLFSKRQANIGRVLEKIIERVDVTEISGSNILSAVKAYLKLDRARQAEKQVPANSPEESSRSVPGPDAAVSAGFLGKTTPVADQNKEKEPQPIETTQLQ